MFIRTRFQLLCLLFAQRRVGDRASSSQGLSSQGLASQGLTLIELLIVIVIVGILSAIASTSFLNAATKARGTEAKTNLSAILRAQQQNYLQHGEFARNLDGLGVGINEFTTNYRYSVHPGGGSDRDIDGNVVTEFSIANAIPQTQVQGYMGKAWLDTSNGSPDTKTVMCEGGIGETYFMDGKLYCP